ncbi:YggT family protein [Thermosyntropha lipolytica DSM 11003]|uniref:YggT family protein n=1 Tax=Thermosyntropha lipolytica DSM 11003 TaxID=1123382 RepID=A0A1M5K8I7_9FIRM|nr:YggT family protein [Thermosyntropha lipolytica]SHG49146.1 YggT family protein [Thermosyntropha lipolytica DSM 11003]
MRLIFELLDTALYILSWLVIIRCILSFVRHDPYQPVIKFVYDVTEPVMRPFRNLVPVVGGIDFSPILVILAIYLVQGLLWKIYYMFL